MKRSKGKKRVKPRKINSALAVIAVVAVSAVINWRLTAMVVLTVLYAWYEFRGVFKKG